MAFFDEIGKRVGEIGQGAQKMAEQSRLQRRIGSMKQELDKIYSQIGKSYYSQYLQGGSNPEALHQMCAMIDTINRDMDSLSKQIDELRQVQRCPQCGAVQGRDSRFCATCGNKLEPEKSTIEQQPPVPTEPDETEAPESGQPVIDPPTESSGNVFINWPEAKEVDADLPEEPKPEE